MTRLAPLAILCLAAAGPAFGEEQPQALVNPFAEPGALNSWVFTSNYITIRDKTLRLDAINAKQQIAAFRRDVILSNVRLEADYMVGASGLPGKRTFGLIFGSTDSETYHCLEISYLNATVYSVAAGERKMIARYGGLFLTDGQWYRPRVETSGPVITVYFGGQQLFVTRSDALKPGYIGVYARDSIAVVRGLLYNGAQGKLPAAWKLVKPEQP